MLFQGDAHGFNGSADALQRASAEPDIVLSRNGARVRRAAHARAHCGW
ncbi:hypothetical protein C7S17_3894 [Burkholderia thailandensis]|nr:hypothetical protein [Burkholderia thailandensis]